MASFTTRDGINNTIVVNPRDGTHSSSIILMHGLGDSADGFCDIGEVVNKHYPHIKVIIPTAPTRPVTINGGALMPAWYDIRDFINNSAEGIDESATIIGSILDQEHALGIPYSRMVLAGFSQGAALSLFLGLQLPPEKKLAGLIVMSGYLPGMDRFNLTTGMEDVRVLHCHGTADSMIQMDKANLTKSYLESKGMVSYELRPIPGMPHTVTDKVMELILAFISEILPHDESYAIKPKLPSEMSIKELKAAVRAANLGAKAVGLSEKAEFVKLLEDHRTV